MTQSPASRTRPEEGVWPLFRAGRPFFGLIDAVLMPDGQRFDFEGAVSEKDAAAAWAWMARDLAPDLLGPLFAWDEAAARQALEALIPQLLLRAEQARAAATEGSESERRMRIQFGGKEAFARFPLLLNVLKCQGRLEQAQQFGTADGDVGRGGAGRGAAIDVAI